MSWAMRLYALVLRFYPQEFRTRFEDEMLEVLAATLNATQPRHHGQRAAVLLREFAGVMETLCRERYAEWRQPKEGEMASGLTVDTSRERGSASTSWVETILGILPFALVGPINVLLAYPYPSSAWWVSQQFTVIRLVVVVLIMLIGLGLGWAKGWPRWAFPYLGLWVMVAGAMLASAINLHVFPRGPEWPADQQFVNAIVAFILVISVLVLLARVLPLLHSLYREIRADWIRLSFGLLLGAALIFGLVEHEQDPLLTIPVLLPSILVFLCALAYLRLPGRVPQAAALVLGVVLPVAVRVAANQPHYLSFGLTILVVVMLPILLELLPHPRALPSH